MKYKNLTIEAIAEMDREELREALWVTSPVSTCVHKTIKKLEAKADKTEREIRELTGTRNAAAKVDAIMSAIFRRQDDLYGAGVLTSYDHSERFC